jgi:hypothetical protein
MATLTCPNCQHGIQLIVQNAPGVTKDPAGALTAKVLRSVLEFMRLHPGKFESLDLYNAYCQAQPDAGWPAVTQQTFLLALRRNGATRWRTSHKRGFEIPELEATAKPASPPPSVAERHEAQAYRETVSANQLPRPAVDPRQFPFGVPSDLPLAIS